MQIMNYSRCIESMGYAHVLSVTLYFLYVYSRGIEASNLEHVSSADVVRLQLGNSVLNLLPDTLREYIFKAN